MRASGRAEEAHRGGVWEEHDELRRHVRDCSKEALDDRLFPDSLRSEVCQSKVAELVGVSWELQEVVRLDVPVGKA